MFGKNIDYWLLRPLAHSCNRATEKGLNERFKCASYSLSEAKEYVEKNKRRFGGHLIVDDKRSYLDIGCGMGRLSFGLIQSGAKDVTAIDIIPRNIEQAKNIAESLDLESQPRFMCTDIHEWVTDRKYDVVTVVGVIEHVHKPKLFLQKLPTLMKSNGIALIKHEPFQGPFGDHLRAFFRLQIPWRGVIFSEKALVTLRREFYRPTDSAQRLKDIVGGLNQMSYSQFLRYSHQAGLEFIKIIINPEFERIKPLMHITNLITKIPMICDYFTHSVWAVLKRKE